MENEELKGVPQVWIDILNTMPDVKESFIEDYDESEPVSGYFFDYLGSYKEYEPFFTCCERGEEVFKLFYDYFGGYDNEQDNKEPKTTIKMTEDRITELLQKHVTGMNYFLEKNNLAEYNFSDMQIIKMNEDDFESKYDTYEIADADINEYYTNFMFHETKSNPLGMLVEPFYALTLCYETIFYFLWPLIKEDTVENPFFAYVELYQKDIRPYIVDKNLIVLVQ
jgi:hypothetical protein